MGVPLRRPQSPSRRANSTSNHPNPNNSSSNNSRSSTTSTTTNSTSNSTTSSTRKISKSRKSRSRSTSPRPRNSYYTDNPFLQRRPVVMMVPNSLLPVSAYFPRDYEFEDEGYDSSSSSTSEASIPAPALGWRPTQGTLEMEFMFGDMDEEFMQELTRESTPSSDDDEVMMEVDLNASGSDEEEETATSMYDYSSEDEGTHERQDRMGGRVVDEDYD